MENAIELDDTGEAIAYAAAIAAAANWRVRSIWDGELEDLDEQRIETWVRGELAEMGAAETYLWDRSYQAAADPDRRVEDALVNLAVFMVATGTGSLAHLDRIHAQIETQQRIATINGLAADEW